MARSRPGARAIEWCTRLPIKMFAGQDWMRVTDDDKYQGVRDFMIESPISGRGPDDGLAHADPPTESEILRMVRTNEFSDVHPYFDASSARRAEDGEVWARRAGRR